MRVRAMLVTVVAVLALASCSGRDTAAPPATSPGDASATPTPSEVTGLRYVALGDSYTAGPLIPTQIPASLLCLRSDRNYPHLLAERLDVASFVDVSCAGATTETVRDGQVTAVDADPDLVTIGVGGNDAGLFATMLHTCSQLARDDLAGSPCREALGETTNGTLGHIGTNVESTLRELRARAPSADLVLVGYPRILPDTGTCAAVPFAAGDYDWARGVEESLDATLARAADAAGAMFVSLREGSRGHDACAGGDAWVNGAVSDRSGALAFHPFAAGMAGMAGIIAAQLPTRGG